MKTTRRDRKRDLYSIVDDDELDRMVLEIHRGHPNTGYKLMRGHLNARGVRVPSEGSTLYLAPIVYGIDGNHKLIRWRFVIHGGVDGFSRLVVYLTAAGNNRAITVLESFKTAVEQYGLPSRVRSDKGGENADVAEFMIRSRGTDRNSHITGRSVHNQRIERMWRDVYEHTLDLFYQIFTSLEYQGLLNPDNEVHLYALHRAFLPVIQQSLNDFRDAWNFHGLRTERNQSPQQLWMRYRDQGPMEDPTQVYDDYGIDWNGPHSLDGGLVSVPEVQLARELSEEELNMLPPVGVSVSDAIQCYLETVEIVCSMTTTN
uniref:uncharacterized protein LOC124065051 n=1 Tax=Scatophagus argus TaxID=75038 RepID=UPI001ED80630|nr:uncharacterized protein LOC124065051 [Scatophagus argus]